MKFARVVLSLLAVAVTIGAMLVVLYHVTAGHDVPSRALRRLREEARPSLNLLRKRHGPRGLAPVAVGVLLIVFALGGFAVWCLMHFGGAR